ncbi:hypothetical protein CERZMDRAFT_98829 [Cercospora zeae-maydis SCOH1-5]|uniref:Alpha-carbonic anhydrase domain-containing protein n=1 Tax=Cercospora zeae-maydis SCOH1-5 TaxID=717836 RepID=A0A6A6FCW6_9PEZI|nr:hypothetical protein CERZMDRAFT_98829 [Cercospora zeae-maydis SCOH1-5]
MRSWSTIGTALLSLLPILSNSCFTKRDSSSEEDWSYDAPDHWADDNPKYGVCRNGTQQSPIDLSDSAMSTSTHRPTFSYAGNWSGSLSNNGHGIQFDLGHAEGDYTSLPQLTFTNSQNEEETVYLSTLHTHAPAEHLPNNDRPTAEMHFVHVDSQGTPRVVVGFLLDPSYNRRDAHSDFFSQFGRLPTTTTTTTTKDDEVELDAFQPGLVLPQVNDFKRFWTYRGSLTTPPCTEGIRWFVAAQTMVLGDVQLQDLLSVSPFAARPTRHVWLHDVGM